MKGAATSGLGSVTPCDRARHPEWNITEIKITDYTMCSPNEPNRTEKEV